MYDDLFIINELGAAASDEDEDDILIALQLEVSADFLDSYKKETVDRHVAETLEEAEKEGVIHRLEEKGSFEFQENGDTRYFNDQFNKLKELVNNLTLETFASKYNVSYKIRQLADSTHNTYVYYVPYGQAMTLDAFVRYMGRSGKKFIVENAFSYHF